MKILVISNLYPPHFIGGYEIACADTVKLLRQSGHECFVLTSDYDSGRMISSEELCIRRSLKLHVDWSGGDKTCDYLATKKHNEFEVGMALDIFEPDFVYFWNIYGLTMIPAIIVRSRGIRSTIHLMDLSLTEYQWSFKRFIWNFLKGRSFELLTVGKYFDNSIAISQFVSKNTTYWKFKRQEVIYPFLDFSVSVARKITYVPNVPFRGVYIGQIEKHKGVVMLCEALNLIKQEGRFDIHLDIYGRSMSGLDIELNERFGDLISIYKNKLRPDILEALPIYDVGFFPSIWDEPFGIAQIELMRAGLPVLTSAQGGSKEVVTNENAVLFKSGDVFDFKDKLENLIIHYSFEASVIGKEAAACVESFYNENIYSAAIENHIKSTIEK